MTYKRCRTVTKKLTDLCYLKIHELEAPDCLQRQQYFLLDRHAINF